MSESIKVVVRVRPILDNDFEGENAEHEAYLQNQESAMSVVSHVDGGGERRARASSCAHSTGC